MPRLTKRAIDALRPSTKDQMVWDDEVRGFGVRVKATGVKSYLIQYRNTYGRSRRFTLGKHGVLTVDEARRKAKKHLAAVQDGFDPADQRQSDRNSISMAELCDRYVTEHAEVYNKPRTASEVRRMVGVTIKPPLGHLAAISVTVQDVMKLHRSMVQTPRMANHAIAVLSKIFNLAEDWGVRPKGSNPCPSVKRYPEVSRERFLSETELARLGSVLANAEKEQTELHDAVNAIRLLALTGCRLNEVLSLKWQDVDFEVGALWLEDAKTGSRAHAIGAPAMALLGRIQRVEGSPWVFRRRNSMEPLPDYTLKNMWRRIRKTAELNDVRLHDLRHTVGTYAGQTGANAFLVRDKLGHKTIAMAGRYVNRDASPLRQLSDQVESRIEAAMLGENADITSMT